MRRRTKHIIFSAGVIAASALTIAAALWPDGAAIFHVSATTVAAATNLAWIWE